MWNKQTDNILSFGQQATDKLHQSPPEYGGIFMVIFASVRGGFINEDKRLLGSDYTY